MKHIKNIFKISIVLLLLLVCIGSIYAADDNQTLSNGDADDVDETVGDDLDDSDDDVEEEGDDESGDDFDEEESDDLDDNIVDDYNYTDYDYLKLKVTYYLGNYGNCSSHNWTESEEFLNEYQMYLANPDIYTLNESAEGYNTYLKIYDSITSTFDDYNLTKNETDYLKFMVIFYLNHYGNVSANYTWNDNESFQNYTLPFDVLLGAIYNDLFKGSATAPMDDNYLNSFNPFYVSFSNSTDVNQTSLGNQDSFEVGSSVDFNIFILILVFVLVFLIML